MKKFVLSLLVVLGLFALACGLLDEEATTITYEAAIPIEFSIDSADFCSDCPDEQADAVESFELDPLEANIPIQASDFQVVGDFDIREITRRMRSMEITSIDYVVGDNSLTFDLPPLDVFVAPLSVTEVGQAGSVHLTTVPQAPAGTDVDANAPVRSEARDPASDLFKELDFRALFTAVPRIEEGQPVPPSGKADIQLIVNVRIVANAVEAARN